MTNDSEYRATVVEAEAPHAVKWAAECIRNGGVVSIPTDTVYGLCASLDHQEAIERLYTIKHRSAGLPVPVLIASVDEIHNLTSQSDERILFLLDQFWPGSLTMVVNARSGLPRHVVANDNTVGVRLPNHPLAIAIIAAAGGAIACTSANVSQHRESRTADEVVASIGSFVDLIVDGGQTPGGQASTVARIGHEGPIILREGPVSATDIAREWRNLTSDL